MLGSGVDRQGTARLGSYGAGCFIRPCRRPGGLGSSEGEQVVQADKGSGWMMLALPNVGLTVRYSRPVLGSVEAASGVSKACSIGVAICILLRSSL